MKSGYAALIGIPNAGKSTLMNRLIGQKIAITSDRPQTTRNRIETVYTDERGQIVFIDTPGIHRAKNKLGEFMDSEAERAFTDADVIIWMVAALTKPGAGEERIACLLKEKNKENRPLILVINKIDKLTDPSLLDDVRETYSGMVSFDEVFAVSALTGEGEAALMDTLFSYMPEGPMYFDEETVTEIPMRHIAEELIREQMLRYLSDEIPHGAAVQVGSFRERKNGSFDIEADIICEKESHKGIVIGKGGSMIRKIGTAAREEIEKQMEAKVNLKLFVKVRKKWRDNELYLKSFGYSDKK